jgi:hypothetical protein
MAERPGRAVRVRALPAPFHSSAVLASNSSAILRLRDARHSEPVDEIFSHEVARRASRPTLFTHRFFRTASRASAVAGPRIPESDPPHGDIVRGADYEFSLFSSAVPLLGGPLPTWRNLLVDEKGSVQRDRRWSARDRPPADASSVRLLSRVFPPGRNLPRQHVTQGENWRLLFWPFPPKNRPPRNGPHGNGRVPWNTASGR